MSKNLLGNRTNRYYLWRYHDENFPWKSTVSIRRGSGRGGSVAEFHWSRNKSYNFKFLFGAENEKGSPFLRIELPYLFFLSFKLDSISGLTKHESRTGLSFHHSTLWVLFNEDGTGWADRMFSLDKTLNFKRLFLGSSNYEKEVIEEKEMTALVPETKNYDEEEINLELTMYSTERWRDYLPFWTTNNVYIEVFSETGVKHPGKGTASYNCGETALLGTSYNMEDLDSDDPWQSAINKFIEGGLKNRVDESQ